jgi:tetratricopeptide (TPR) repeat protein
LLIAFDSEAADRGFKEALEAINQLSYSRSIDLAYLFRYWIAFDPYAVAEILPQLPVTPDNDTIEWILALGMALESKGRVGVLKALKEQIIGLLPKNSDPYVLSRSLVVIARCELAHDEQKKATTTLARALKICEKIGTRRGVEVKLQDRKSYDTTALIAAVAIAWQINQVDALQILQRAWKSLREFGYCKDEGTEVVTLVQTQFMADRDLLEAY